MSVFHPEGVKHHSPANIAGKKDNEQLTRTPKGCHINSIMTTVKLFGALRDRAGTGKVEIPEGVTIREILDRLGEKYGPPVRDLLLEEKAGRPVKRQPVVILIAGLPQLDLERRVGPEETVSIFPAVAGG